VEGAWVFGPDLLLEREDCKREEAKKEKGDRDKKKRRCIGKYSTSRAFSRTIDAREAVS
jgi:hypothetical protein